MVPALEEDAKKDENGPVSIPSSLDLPSQLKWYYSRLFPVNMFARWLGYGSDEYLARREISFTLPGDIYLRFRSFGDAEELLQTLKSRTPIKIDIGAVYNFAPKDKNSVSSALTPQAKELVFDIDLDDYEDVMRDLTKHQGESPADRCDRHWAYMATAVKVLDAALREDFGFERIMWVYSGRRGIHAWICDARARTMNNEQRSAVADYLAVRASGRGALSKLGAPPLHPSLARARGICDSMWIDNLLFKQQAISPDNVQATMADVMQDCGGMGALRDGWLERLCDEKRGDPQERWKAFEQEVRKSKKHDFGFKAVADYVVLRHTYPRLDVNVSKEISHLLKAPFCVHPKTGRVCIPFLAENVDQFNPASDAPLAAKLIAEIGRKGEKMETEKMNKAVRIFHAFVKSLEEDAKTALMKEQLNRLDEKGAKDLLAI